MSDAACVLGFAAHSGWAVVVALGGAADGPRVLARERIELCDPGQPRSRQPYHTAAQLPPGEAQPLLARFAASASRRATEAIAELTRTLRAAGAEPRSAGLIGAAGRALPTVEAVLASHALIHAAEGEHFREALRLGCQATGLAVTRVPKRELASQAAATLKMAEPQLSAAVAALGRDLGSPWAVDQKSAALIAWLLLARAQSPAEAARPRLNTTPNGSRR
jgi:hypothetical protein